MNIDMDFLIAFCLGAIAAWSATAGYHVTKMEEKQIEIERLRREENLRFIQHERMLEYREDESI